MSPSQRILLVGRDTKVAQVIQDALRTSPHFVVQVAKTVDDATSRLGQEPFALVLLHLSSDARLQDADQLLWASSRGARRIPLVVIGDRYRPDQALTLFRMGVADYLSQSHHLGRLSLYLSAIMSGAEDRCRLALDRAEHELPCEWFPSGATSSTLSE